MRSVRNTTGKQDQRDQGSTKGKIIFFIFLSVGFFFFWVWVAENWIALYPFVVLDTQTYIVIGIVALVSTYISKFFIKKLMHS